jgi:hypothetical protein
MWRQAWSSFFYSPNLTFILNWRDLQVPQLHQMPLITEALSSGDRFDGGDLTSSPKGSFKEYIDVQSI